MVAVPDASECPPTYGAAFSDVCGFVLGGWASLANDGGDLSDHTPLPPPPATAAGAGAQSGAGAGAGSGTAATTDATAAATSTATPHHPRRYYNISVEDFSREIGPTLSDADVVIMLGLQQVRRR